VRSQCGVIETRGVHHDLRREFLHGAGALTVSFRFARNSMSQQEHGQFGTCASQIDPDKLDSWIAVNADGGQECEKTETNAVQSSDISLFLLVSLESYLVGPEGFEPPTKGL
jgi:hypothetical protein